jgi:hypothetical protein
VFARSSFCDITPRDRPIRLAGYAARTKPVSIILDPIEISAVLLECDGARCLILGFDLMIVGSELQDMILARLAEHGFEPNEIVLLASHTHFGPATDQACARLGVPETRFVRDVAEAAEGLVLKMLQQQPSEITLQISQGRLNHSVNRRRFWPFPTLGRTYGFRLNSIAMAPDPQGATEEIATVVLLRRVTGDEVLGVIWHYTCHPTAVIPNNAVSSDFPGAVRRALRARFGNIACVFAQGFCGDVSPMLRPAARTSGFRERLRRVARKVMSGPTFPAAAAEDWTRWSESLAAKVVEIAHAPPQKTAAPATLATGSASIPLGDFFDGSAPDKPLTAQAVRLGDALELIALSAEVTVEWQAIVDRALPVRDGRIRLYAGYLGALFGYLPTPVQIREGGYEVAGFQPLFGLSGKFDAEKITPAVIDCVKQAIAGLEPPG